MQPQFYWVTGMTVVRNRGASLAGLGVTGDFREERYLFIRGIQV